MTNKGIIENESLKLESLNIGYGNANSKTIIYSNINAISYKGELISLIGANGKGKSTLIRTIIGLQKELGGNIKLAGKNKSKYSHKELSSLISFVPSQSPRVNNFTVFELISLNCYYSSNWLGQIDINQQQKVHNALESVGLQGFANKDSSTLSDGEYQRCMIAGSLVKDSEIIILDEPTAFLDIANKYTITHLLKAIARKKNKTIIFSSHDLHISIDISDKIWLMGKDEFCQGNPRDLIEQDSFNSIFSDNSMFFNKEKGIFEYKKYPNRQNNKLLL